MKALKIIGLIVLAIAVVVLIVPLFLPSTFHVERNVVIEKPVSSVFQYALNYEHRKKWDPWLEMEPEAEVTINVEPGFVGSNYSWEGEIIGSGKMTILNFDPNKRIESKIEFFSPRQTSSDVIWTFEEGENGTRVTWAFEGDSPYPIGRWFGLMMDGMMGDDFQHGLDKLKYFIENEKPTAITSEVQEIMTAEILAMTITKEANMENISQIMGEAYEKIMQEVGAENIGGYPFAIYLDYSEDGSMMVEMGIPVREKMNDKGDVKFKEFPSIKVLMVKHTGPYDQMPQSYEIIQKYMQENSIMPAGAPWDIYITDPQAEPDQSKWETLIYFPI